MNEHAPEWAKRSSTTEKTIEEILRDFSEAPTTKRKGSRRMTKERNSGKKPDQKGS